MNKNNLPRLPRLATLLPAAIGLAQPEFNDEIQDFLENQGDQKELSTICNFHFFTDNFFLHLILQACCIGGKVLRYPKQPCRQKAPVTSIILQASVSQNKTKNMTKQTKEMKKETSKGRSRQ